jgi:hypothetical protein
VTDPRLPRAVALSAGVQLQTVDFVVVQLVGTATAAGIITLSPPDPVDPDQFWRIERISVTPHIAGVETIQCGVYGGDPSPFTIRDWVDLPAGTIGIAEYPQPMTILSSTLLTLQITGAAAGDTAAAVVQYAVVQRVSGGS